MSLTNTACLGYFLIVIASPYPADFITCASITTLQSCEQTTWIFSSGTTIDSSLYTGATGVIISTSRLSWSMGPPSENEWPVEPLGVATMTPSIFWRTVSSWNLMSISAVFVRLVLCMSISLRAGGNLSRPHEADTLVRRSSMIFPDRICEIASSSPPMVISESMPRLPPTFTVRTGVSSSSSRNVRRVVPSPPSVTTRSGLAALRSAIVSAASAPGTDAGETACTAHFAASSFFATLRAASSDALDPIFETMATLRSLNGRLHCPDLKKRGGRRAWGAGRWEGGTGAARTAGDSAISIANLILAGSGLGAMSERDAGADRAGGLDRRDFLKLVGAAGAGLAVGSLVPWDGLARSGDNGGGGAAGSGFATSICCIDGRVQAPLAEWTRARSGAAHVDTVTEPGVDKFMSEDAAIAEAVRKKASISVDAHGSPLIVISGHYDCAANPVPDDVHMRQVAECVKVAKSWNTGAEIVGVWVGADWKVVQI